MLKTLLCLALPFTLVRICVKSDCYSQEPKESSLLHVNVYQYYFDIKNYDIEDCCLQKLNLHQNVMLRIFIIQIHWRVDAAIKKKQAVDVICVLNKNVWWSLTLPTLTNDLTLFLLVLKKKMLFSIWSKVCRLKTKNLTQTLVPSEIPFFPNHVFNWTGRFNFRTKNVYIE